MTRNLYTNKTLFQWFSDLPDCDKNRTLILGVSKKVEAARKSPKTVRPYTSYIPSSSDHIDGYIDDICNDNADGCNENTTSTDATEILNNYNRTPSHYRHSSCSTVTVRELSDHHCFTQNNLKIGQTSPKLFSSASTITNDRTLLPNSIRKSTNESTQVVVAINDKILPTAQHVLYRQNASDLTTHIKNDVKNLTDCFHAKSVNSTPVSRKTNLSSTATAATTDVAAVFNPPVTLRHHSLDLNFGEKSLSCRLYDCMPIGACTARNESCEPADSKQPSVASKLDFNLRKNSISRSAQLSKRRFLQSVMDRSMDSIGSCSLDVDAVSTDFSGTQTNSKSATVYYCIVIIAHAHFLKFVRHRRKWLMLKFFLIYILLL